MSPSVSSAKQGIAQLCLNTQMPTTLPCVQAVPTPEGLALYQTPTGSLLFVQKKPEKDTPHYKIRDQAGAIRTIPDAVDTHTIRKQYFCTTMPVFGITANHLLVAPLCEKQPDTTSYGVFQTRGPKAWLQINTLDIPASTPHILLTDGRFIVREHTEDPHNPNNGPTCLTTFNLSTRTWMQSEDLSKSCNTAMGCYYALPGGSLLYINMGGTFTQPNIVLWEYDFRHRELNSTRFQFKDGTLWGDYKNHTRITCDGSFSLLANKKKSPAIYFGATHDTRGAVNGYTITHIKEVKGNDHDLTIVPLESCRFAVLFPGNNTKKQKPVSWFYQMKHDFSWEKITVPFVLPQSQDLRWHAVNEKTLITSSDPHFPTANLALHFSDTPTDQQRAKASIQLLLGLKASDRSHLLNTYKKPKHQQSLALLMHGCASNMPIPTELSAIQRKTCVTALGEFAKSPHHTAHGCDAFYASLIQGSSLGDASKDYVFVKLPELLDIHVPPPLHLAVKCIFSIETNRMAYGKTVSHETRHAAFHALTLAILEHMHHSREGELFDVTASIVRIFPTSIYANTRDELWRVVHDVIGLAFHPKPEETVIRKFLAKVKICVAQIRFINAVRKSNDATLRNEVQRIITIFRRLDGHHEERAIEDTIRHFAHCALENSASNLERCTTSFQIAEELKKINSDMWFDYVRTIIPIIRDSNAETLARFTTLLHNAHKAISTRHDLFHPIDAALNHIASLWITHHRPTHFWNALQGYAPLLANAPPRKKLEVIIRLLEPFRKHWNGDTHYDWRNSLLGNILSSLQPVTALLQENIPVIVDACFVCANAFEENDFIVQYKDADTTNPAICHGECLIGYIASGNCTALDVINAHTGQFISTTQWINHGLHINDLERWIAFTGRHLMVRYHQDLPYEFCPDIACIGGAIVEHKDAKQLSISATQRALLLQEAREETRCCLCDKSMNTQGTGEARRQAFERQVYRLITGLLGITCNGANITRECPHCAHADEKDMMCAQIIGGCPNCHKPWNWHTGTSEGHEFFMEGQPIQAYTLKAKCIEQSPLYAIGLITQPNLRGLAAQQHIVERLGLGQSDVLQHNGSLSIPLEQIAHVMLIVENRVTATLRMHWCEEEKIAKQKKTVTAPLIRTRLRHAWS